MPLENEMKKPKKFIQPFGVLNIGMAVNIILYTLIGLFGYIRYGRDVDPTITTSLTKESIESLGTFSKDDLGKAVQLLLASSIFLSHALQCYVIIDILWNYYIFPKIDGKVPKKWMFFWEYVVRTSIVLFTCNIN